MNAVAIVAAGPDARFAEQVRAGLQAAGREASVRQQLPSDPSAQVVLIWSAALEAAHAIDAQALIGLWSENRLVVARRDNAPLPLGLRDLPSLGPEQTAAAVCAAVVGPAAVVVRKPRSLLLPGLAVLASVALVLGGSWYWYNKGNIEKQAALTTALESATQAAEELKAAQAKQLEALKALEQAREAEVKARAAGDAVALTQAREAARGAEEEAKTQAALVKAQEEKATKAREDIKKAQDAAKQAKTEPAKQETVAAAAPKAEAPAPKAEAPRAEEPKVEAPETEAKSAVKSSHSPGATSRSEHERLADEEAARKALAKSGHAPEKQEQVASAAPTVVAAAPSGPPGSTAAAGASTENETLYQQALAMENGGDAKGAIRIYRRAARAGSGKAAKRLGEIFDRGVPGVSRDYAESLQWYETARQLGESVETAGHGGAPSRHETVAARPAPAPKVAPVPAPATPPAPAKSADTAPAPAPATAPVAVPVVPAPEPAPETHRLGSWRFLLIAAFVLAIVFWRRSRRRRRRADAAAPLADAPAAAASAPMPAAPAPIDATMLFVSYSHKDRVRVEPIVSAIEQMGRRVWMDRSDITGQTGWAGQIVRAIRECRAVVLMASPNSYGSDQVVRELYLAMNHKKAIVPIEIEPAEMPDELQYILAPFQHHRLSGGETRAVLGRALAAI